MIPGAFTPMVLPGAGNDPGSLHSLSAASGLFKNYIISTHFQFISVKAEISRCQDKVKASSEEFSCAKSKLEEKLQDLSEMLLQLELLKKRQDGIEKQKSDVLRQQSNLLLTLEEIKKKTTEEQDKFIREITDFNHEYNLMSNREVLVESRAKSEIWTLEKEIDALNREMVSMEQKNIRLNAIQTEKITLKKLLVELEDQIKDLEKEMSEAVAITECLQAEKIEIGQKPQTDSEFLRLKKELEAFKDGELESVREALRTEIQFLQMKVSQKGLQVPSS
ncbi:coiled-coil domain-containing protein 172 [Polyodon spathula]|uniref:coiled-coil domain-containing protein 172 n=1 Tax=Polyodon spathula TaxID=7913 RepID=UPI001B7E4CA3|nr:coiled-coil domain-containing protein 172 [Polyodon spathula]